MIVHDLPNNCHVNKRMLVAVAKSLEPVPKFLREEEDGCRCINGMATLPRALVRMQLSPTYTQSMLSLRSKSAGAHYGALWRLLLIKSLMSLKIMHKNPTPSMWAICLLIPCSGRRVL